MQQPLQKPIIGYGLAHQDGNSCNDRGRRGPSEQRMRYACVVNRPHPEAEETAKYDSRNY